MFVVLVNDTSIDSYCGGDEVEIIGPFPTENDAIEWGFKEQRYIVNIYPVTYREPS